MNQPETNDEAVKLFRQSYRDAPADPDVAGLYGAVAVDSANEGFGIIDGVAQRFPTYAIVALNNAVTGPEVRDGARNKKYIARLSEILPEKACSSSHIHELLMDGSIEDARTRVDQCVALFGAGDAWPDCSMSKARRTRGRGCGPTWRGCSRTGIRVCAR